MSNKVNIHTHACGSNMMIYHNRELKRKAECLVYPACPAAFSLFQKQHSLICLRHAEGRSRDLFTHVNTQTQTHKRAYKMLHSNNRILELHVCGISVPQAIAKHSKPPKPPKKMKEPFQYVCAFDTKFKLVLTQDIKKNPECRFCVIDQTYQIFTCDTRRMMWNLSHSFASYTSTLTDLCQCLEATDANLIDGAVVRPFLNLSASPNIAAAMSPPIKK